MELVWINGHDLRRDARCFRTLMLSLMHDLCFTVRTTVTLFHCENDCDFVSPWERLWHQKDAAVLLATWVFKHNQKSHSFAVFGLGHTLLMLQLISRRDKVGQVNCIRFVDLFIYNLYYHVLGLKCGCNKIYTSYYILNCEGKSKSHWNTESFRNLNFLLEWLKIGMSANWSVNTWYKFKLYLKKHSWFINTWKSRLNIMFLIVYITK